MLFRTLVFAAACLLAACGGGGGGGGAPAPGPAPQPTQFRIGGTVSGLNGSLVLQLNNGETLTVSSSGAFTFTGQLASGGAYQVRLTTQPVGQECSIVAGSGTVSGDVSAIQVTCSNVEQIVSGSVSGLSGALTLLVNGANPLILSSNGTFSFPLSLQPGTPYQVTLGQQPGTQSCQLSSASGTVGSSAPNVIVNCINTYLVGVSFSGVRGYLVLQNNDSGELAIPSNGGTVSGTAYFPGRTPSGATYDIGIRTQPAGQECTVSNGSGTVANSDVVAASIVCETIVSTYTVGGAVTGLSGMLRLRNAASDEVTLASDGAFTFGARLPEGSPYDVTIESQPAAQRCVVSAGSGVIGTSNVTTVAVNCTDLTPHTLGGRLIGVTSPIVLRNQGENPLTLANDGAFSFTTPLVLDTEYEVTASSADPNQMCHVARGIGTMPDEPVANISVVCSAKRPTRFVYVVNEGDYGLGGIFTGASVSQYSVGADGALTAMSPATVTAGERPLSITVHPSGDFAYVRSTDAAGTGATSFWQYSIASSGALTPMSTPSVSGGTSVGYLVIEPGSAYAYATRGGDVLRFAINADGSLAPPSVQTLSTGPYAFRSIVFDRAGEHAYVTGADAEGDGVVYQFSVASDGSFVAMSPASKDAGLPFVSAQLAEPFDRFVYAVDGGFSRIVQFRREDDGALAALDSPSPFNATVFPSGIASDPFGRFAYTSAPGSISTFVIGPTGALIPGIPDGVRPGDQESFHSIAVDLAGEYIYVTASEPNGNWVHQYLIGSDGALTRMDAASVATGLRPGAIAVAK